MDRCPAASGQNPRSPARCVNLLALEFRAVIDQAKGILMERHEMTADQAFQALAQASRNVDRRLRDIADRLVTTGELSLR
jgi:AmiR/NasT family two-component response regulator